MIETPRCRTRGWETQISKGQSSAGRMGVLSVGCEIRCSDLELFGLPLGIVDHGSHRLWADANYNSLNTFLNSIIVSVLPF